MIGNSETACESKVYFLFDVNAVFVVNIIIKFAIIPLGNNVLYYVIRRLAGDGSVSETELSESVFINGLNSRL